MALKNYNPVTPGQRQLVLVDRSGLHTGAPVKALTEGKSSSGGRNNSGSITSRYRGGGHKGPIARSTSSAASSMLRPRLSGWSTIRTAPPLSL